jgi:hypothetical protein
MPGAILDNSMAPEAAAEFVIRKKSSTWRRPAVQLVEGHFRREIARLECECSRKNQFLVISASAGFAWRFTILRPRPHRQLQDGQDLLVRKPGGLIFDLETVAPLELEEFYFSE